MRSRLFLIAALVAACQAIPALADEATPWLADTALLEQTRTDVAAAGLRGVTAHVDALEKALAGAQRSIALARDAGFVLTDGPRDTLLGLMTAATSKDHKSVSAIADPYPLIGLYLGSYYDEIGRKEDGLRVLDAGLAVSPTSSTRPLLIVERGAALNGLHRFADALADFDDGLKIDGVDDRLRGAMMRGRGFSLTELNRLDEAEASYRDSLKVEPGNSRALNELNYIAHLRAGAKPVEGSYQTVGPKMGISAPEQGTPTAAPATTDPAKP